MFFLYLLFNSVYILLDSIFEPKAVSLAENFYTAFYLKWIHSSVGRASD